MDTSEKLSEYCSLHNDELSEAVSLLIELSRYDYCFLNAETRKAIEVEMEAQLKNYDENTAIIEKEVTETRKIKELEWLEYK